MTSDDFLTSFYGMWFTNMPACLIDSVIKEVSRQAPGYRSKCPRLYDEYIQLRTVTMLLALSPVGKLCIEYEGKQVELQSLNTTGAIANIKRESIDNTITIEYHKTGIPDGLNAADFPFGMIKSRLDYIEKACNTVLIGGFGFRGC